MTMTNVSKIATHIDTTISKNSHIGIFTQKPLNDPSTQ